MVRKITRPTLMSRELNDGKSNKKIGNKSPEKMNKFKYLGTNIRNQNSIHEKKSRLN
jgi:hypothetical protein